MLQPPPNPVRLPIPLVVRDESALAEIFTRTLEIRRRSVLVRQDEPSHDIKVIRHGIASRIKANAHGEQQIVGIITRGDICNVASLFFEGADHAVETVTDCEIAVAKKSDALNLMESCPAIAKAMMALVVAGEAIAHEWVLNVGRRNAHQRIAHLLCEIIRRNRDFDRDDVCSFPMTQANLADATGLSVVQVNRSLQELRASGLITLEHRVLTVHDWPRLCDIADFDPSYLH